MAVGWPEAGARGGLRARAAGADPDPPRPAALDSRLARVRQA
jgi:hypothetical protein